MAERVADLSDFYAGKEPGQTCASEKTDCRAPEQVWVRGVNLSSRGTWGRPTCWLWEEGTGQTPWPERKGGQGDRGHSQDSEEAQAAQTGTPWADHGGKRACCSTARPWALPPQVATALARLAASEVKSHCTLWPSYDIHAAVSSSCLSWAPQSSTRSRGFHPSGAAGANPAGALREAAGCTGPQRHMQKLSQRKARRDGGGVGRRSWCPAGHSH